jgi:two-component sensor histidine kinase
MVRTMAVQTLREGGSEDAMQRFDARLTALAAVYDLLEDAAWNGADLAALARREIEQYVAADGIRFTAEGEPVSLPANLAMQVGIALHELAAVAARRRTFGPDGGIATLHWSVASTAGARTLTLDWRERHEAAAIVWGVTMDSSLIERVMPGATVTCVPGTEGYAVSIEVGLPTIRTPTTGA